MQPLSDQLLALMLMTLWGIIIGLLYDCYFIIRQIWQLKRWGTILGDLTFWVIGTILTYLFLLCFFWGEVRFSIFLGISIGLVLYFCFGSSIARLVLLHSYMEASRIIIVLIKLSVAPFQLSWRIMRTAMRFLTYPCRLISKLKKSKAPQE